MSAGGEEPGQHGDDGLAGPAALVGAVLLGLSGATDLVLVAAEGDAAGLGEDLAVVLLGLAELHTVDDVGGLEGVLEVNTQVVSLGVGSLGGHLGLPGVVSHIF